jgi:phage shock protein PspC (stress-responsive transcriptional regulator)
MDHAGAGGRVMARENNTETAAPTAPRYSLRRSQKDRMVAGVCGGIAETFGIDPALVRIGLVALTVLGAGSGVLLYAAAWVLVPEAE